MKHLTLILTLFFSTLMIASPVYADWERVDGTGSGDAAYVDFDRIRTNGGYVYYWYLIDLLKPSKHGDLSSKTYIQGDCEMFRYKYLSLSFHKQPMGEGEGGHLNVPNPEWYYPPPNSAVEEILEQVCEYAKYL